MSDFILVYGERPDVRGPFRSEKTAIVAARELSGSLGARVADVVVVIERKGDPGERYLREVGRARAGKFQSKKRTGRSLGWFVAGTAVGYGLARAVDNPEHVRRAAEAAGRGARTLHEEGKRALHAASESSKAAKAGYGSVAGWKGEPAFDPKQWVYAQNIGTWLAWGKPGLGERWQGIVDRFNDLPPHLKVIAMRAERAEKVRLHGSLAAGASSGETSGGVWWEGRFWEDLTEDEKARYKAQRRRELEAIGRMSFPFDAFSGDRPVKVLGPVCRFSPYKESWSCQGDPVKGNDQLLIEEPGRVNERDLSKPYRFVGFASSVTVNGVPLLLRGIRRRVDPWDAMWKKHDEKFGRAAGRRARR